MKKTTYIMLGAMVAGLIGTCVVALAYSADDADRADRGGRGSVSGQFCGGIIRSGRYGMRDVTEEITWFQRRKNGEEECVKNLYWN